MFSKIVRRAASLGLALGVAAATVIPAGADDGGMMPTSHPFLALNQLGLSQNWAGWASYAGLAGLAKNGAVSYVKGEWVVPAVACGSGDADSSVWVGIDGLYNQFVEQVGTEQRCTGGVASYAAWWETYPAPKTTAALTVRPGDTVRGEVTYVGSGTFTLAVTNLTTGQSFKTTQAANGPRQSAEWVVEAPYNNGIMPLANFGMVSFDNAVATINGKTNPIASSGLLSILNTQGATMASLQNLSLVKATATNPSLNAGHDNFKVTWHHS